MRGFGSAASEQCCRSSPFHARIMYFFARLDVFGGIQIFYKLISVCLAILFGIITFPIWYVTLQILSSCLSCFSSGRYCCYIFWERSCLRDGKPGFELLLQVPGPNYKLICVSVNQHSGRDH
jgi:hypothetical protein